MKSLIVACMLVCLVGCGAAPSTSDPVTGTTSPDTTSGDGGPVLPTPEDDLTQHCGEWHWVTVWENGTPTAQLQPIICVSGKNPDTGDPAPKVVDPNPWEQNVRINKLTNTQH